MDVNKMLVELRQEREQIEEAIIILERLARGTREAARSTAALDDDGRSAGETPRPSSWQQEQTEGRESGRSLKKKRVRHFRCPFFSAVVRSVKQK